MTTIDTRSALFTDTIMAYRSARQAGEMDHLAFMAAIQVFETLQSAACTALVVATLPALGLTGAKQANCCLA